MSDLSGVTASLKESYRLVEGIKSKLDEKVLAKPELFADRMY